MHGRGGFGEYAAMDADHDRLRGALAGLLGAGIDEIALTTSVTAGLGHAIWGIDWQPGDEVITTSLEHPGLTVPLAVLARRRGVRVHTIGLETGGEDLEGRFASLAGAKTRLVALSHVAWTTGARMDVEGAARAAHRVGALTLVDGAQGVGAIPTTPRDLGCDLYAFPAHKWLLGPEGLGGLWIAQESLARIDLTFGGMGSGVDHGSDGSVTQHPGARKLELGLLPEILAPGWIASLEWLAGLADPNGSAIRRGWSWIWAQTAANVARAREVLRGAGASIVTPAGREAGLVTFTLAGIDPEDAAARLEAQGIVLRWVPDPRAVRVSVGFFTTEDDLMQLATALDGLTG
jgi:L-cysteine/cystine lyase